MLSPMKIVAAFDFDGTLTERDSLLPFLIYNFGFFRTAWGLLLEAPFLLGFILGLTSRQKTKEKILTRFLKGLAKCILEEQGQAFAEQIIPKLLKKNVYEKLQWHMKKGHCCILVSASIEIYLKPWSASVGFQHLICSNLRFDKQGLFIGQLEGLNCWGPEKERRLLELLGPRENFILYVYGDSRGDKELLALANYSTKVL